MKKKNTPFIAACILSVILVAGAGVLLFSSVKVVDVTTQMTSAGMEADGDTAAAAGAESAADETVGAGAESAADETAGAAEGSVTESAQAESDVSKEEPAVSSGESTAESAASPEDKAAESTDSKKSAKKKDKASEAESAAAEDEAADFMATQLARTKNDPTFWADCPPRDVELLTLNPYSRGGEPLTAVNTLVIHYVGNAGTTAMDNRDYFEELKDTHITSASSHFIIGLDGEIVQCIPLSEVAYATKERNVDTISIECCHPEDDGKFNDATYASLVELSAFLCKSFDINPQEIIRHYDVTGKLCPLYYVEYADEWQELKDRIEARTDELKAAQEGSAG